MKKQKGLNPVIAIIGLVVIAIIIVAVFLSAQKTQQTTQVSSPSLTLTPTSTPTSNVPAIQNPSDLNAATADLDKTDLNDIDKQLNQLDTDASTF